MKNHQRYFFSINLLEGNYYSETTQLPIAFVAYKIMKVVELDMMIVYLFKTKRLRTKGVRGTYI